MATIAATNMAAVGAVTAAVTTLTGTDDFTYSAGKRPVLVLNNVTAGALTPVIDGDGAGSVSVAGVGSVDISGGFSVGSIAAGATVTIQLDSIKSYLAGTIAVTGGTGIEAMLLEF